MVHSIPISIDGAQTTIETSSDGPIPRTARFAKSRLLLIEMAMPGGRCREISAASDMTASLGRDISATEA